MKIGQRSYLLKNSALRIVAIVWSIVPMLSLLLHRAEKSVQIVLF